MVDVFFLFSATGGYNKYSQNEILNEFSFTICSK